MLLRMHQPPRLERRVLLASAASLLGGGLLRQARAADAASRPNALSVCLFSKPLQNRAVAELGPVVRELGFDAVDLTCRPGGHVLPERVVDDLPRTRETLAKAGVRIAMITTAVLDARKDHAEKIFRTAGGLGIRYAKLGYYPYRDLRRIHATLRDVGTRMKELAALAHAHGVHIGYHNHSGQQVGAPLWDTWGLIKDLPAEDIGFYFDAGHATVEGGSSGWRIGLGLLAPRITMLAVKDFIWAKDEKRGWRPRWGPLGEGMVNWSDVLRRLREERFEGPISLHMEYGADGPAGSAADTGNLAAIRRDNATLRGLLKRAELI